MAGTHAAEYCNYSAYGIVRVCQGENKKAASPQPTLKSMPLKNCYYQGVEKRALNKAHLVLTNLSVYQLVSLPAEVVHATPICSTPLICQI